jgi:hypothetical protein
MRVICIHIPKNSMPLGGAFYFTKYMLFNSTYFEHQLRELAESIWEPFSLEIFTHDRNIYFCMAGSEEMIDVLATGVYSWMGSSQIFDIDDYTDKLNSHIAFAGADLRLDRPDIYPIQDYNTFKTNTLIPQIMALQTIPAEDSVLIQLIIRPIKQSFSSHLALANAKANAKLRDLFYLRKLFTKDLDVDVKALSKAKCSSQLFWVTHRISSFSSLPKGSNTALVKKTQERVRKHVESMVDTMKCYNLSHSNSIRATSIRTDSQFKRAVRERRFKKPYRLSSSELTTLYHPPTLGELTNTAQVLSKRAPAPPALPKAETDPLTGNFAHTNYRDHEIDFGINRLDRRRHLYVLGKSGTGKSCLLQLLVKDDIDKGFGCAVLDPHGDLIDEIIRLIPPERAKDVVLFDPAQDGYAPRFNPMAPVRPELKLRVAMSFLDSFKRIFGADWSEKMDHILRYAVLGLLSSSDCSLSNLRRMLSDNEFRMKIIRQAKDESVKRFWLRDFSQRRKEFEEGPMSRLLNKLDELLATESMREIFSSTENLFDFRTFMDQQMIVLLKVSKGYLGSDNASLLGSMLIWKIYEAAMSRADIPSEDRQDFYLYVDEFQNFATESFGEILSEARKYNLSLTFANQYLSQLPASIRQTIFGNISNLLSFRVGADDARAIENEFSPVFDSGDLVNLALRNFYLKMSVNGHVEPPFSGRTLNLTYPERSQTDLQKLILDSLKAYSSVNTTA